LANPDKVGKLLSKCLRGVEGLYQLLCVLQHVTPRVASTLSQELYVFGAAGLQQQFVVRPCDGDADVAEVEQLVQSLLLGSVILADVQQYIRAHRDNVCHLMFTVCSVLFVCGDCGTS